MGSIMWGKEIAEAYDMTSAAMYDPTILDPTEFTSESDNQVAVFTRPRSSTSTVS